MSFVQEEENIQVVVRIRPINEKEKTRGEVPCVRSMHSNPLDDYLGEDSHDSTSWSVSNPKNASEGQVPPDGKVLNEVQVRTGPHDAHVYNCNRCFPPVTTQQDFFRECGLTGLLDSAIGGYRSCAFAFGQTGAGKTYTIVGPGKMPTPTLDHIDDGILGNSLLYLFKKLDSLHVEYKLRLSCMEIYKEQVYDLLGEYRYS